MRFCGVWRRGPPPSFAVSRCFQYLKISQKNTAYKWVYKLKKSYGLIILYPEVPVIIKTVVSRIKPIVRAVKNLLRSDTPKLTNIGLPK